MANRYYNNVAFTLSPAVVKIFARVTFGGSGVPTLVQGNPPASKGVVSVTHDGTGLYTFVFGTQTGMLDVYNALLDVNVFWDETNNSGNAPAAPLYYLSNNSVSTAGTCSLQLKFTDKAQVGATDPGSGEAAYFEFTFKNSNAP